MQREKFVFVHHDIHILFLVLLCMYIYPQYHPPLRNEKCTCRISTILAEMTNSFNITQMLCIYPYVSNIRLYDKNSESDFFFPPPKSEYFFQQHWESEYFFRKKNILKFVLSHLQVITVFIGKYLKYG